MASLDDLKKVTIGPIETNPQVKLVGYCSQWKIDFQQEQTKIKDTLGATALKIEHVGSTSVPGLTAKPIIDILLIVPDSADEAAYVTKLVVAGYVLRIREPDWYQHRMFYGPEHNLHLHVFSQGCLEAQRMLNFRDWLRINETDRLKYQQTKIRLAQQNWSTMQDYADAKGPIVTEINARAQRYLG
ncbi:hypothetical protein [Lactobacillus coryniformis subsp. coryniformis KCTC 3167 = DSM 20001] [Lactiplantibacillus mudanjiangensis]|uniref:GrpB family protein n=1 Tax=Lactiplantibacillus mudanjiangensis TaxID=1296538 RepID=UPI001015AB8F|nr:GrpB family protein [Lactiplantibacillus mudanjiangensis]VDG30786.1 hypothetical protein [Lactobacillus coryniformis subsp. coryniformis KCTC 3167 = DSM 20001] [Lactiplantibacillus mudanjiangensis]